MNIFLLSRKDAIGWDEYVAKVVVAKSENDARKLANECAGDEGAVWDMPDIVECKLVDTENAHVVLESWNAS